MRIYTTDELRERNGAEGRHCHQLEVHLRQ